MYTKGLKCCNSLMHLTRLLLCIKISLLGYECQRRFYRLQLAIILQAMPKVTSSKVIWKMMIWPFTPLWHTQSSSTQWQRSFNDKRTTRLMISPNKRARREAFNFAVGHHRVRLQICLKNRPEYVQFQNSTFQTNILI